MKKIFYPLFLALLLMVMPSYHASAATAQEQAITNAQAQAIADSADAKLQLQKADDARKAADAHAALLASDQASVDSFDAVLQQTIITANTLIQQNAGAAQIAAAQAKINDAGARLHQAKATLARDSGDAAAAANEARLAQIDASAAAGNATSAGAEAAKLGQGSQSSGSSSFVPLTSLPGIKGFAGQSSLPNLLNYLYKILIGVAAVLAVLQIMRAGILYMGGDSVTEKKQAKDLLAVSIGGLLLVLSPYIIFSIINPNILNLQIGKVDLDSPGSSSQTSPTTQSGASSNSAECTQYPEPIGVPSGGVCPADKGYKQIPATCCAGIAPGDICCAKPK